MISVLAVNPERVVPVLSFSPLSGFSVLERYLKLYYVIVLQRMAEFDRDKIFYWQPYSTDLIQGRNRNANLL